MAKRQYKLVGHGDHVHEDGLMYQHGDVVESEHDLRRKFRGKFDLVSGQQPSKGKRITLPGEPPLSREEALEREGMDLGSMTVRELKEFAEAEEIELGAARTKEEILIAIEQQL